MSRSKEDVLAALKQFKSHDARWGEGRVWAGVYDAGSEVEAVAQSAYTEFLNENALYINMFPSVLALETEVVNWVKQLLRAPADARGNFTHEGVSSMSADLHKYGYTAKNASTVIFRSAALRRHALYANAHTTGYALVNSTIASSRSSGPIAAAWATIQTLGDDGYARIVRDTMAATTRLREGVNAIDGLRVMAEPAMCMFTMQCSVASVFVIEDEMLARGWHVQTQFQAPGTPANLHLSINQSNVTHVERFLADLKSSVEAARKEPPVNTQPLVAMVMQALQNPQAMDLNALMSQLGGGTGKMPERWAMINTLLDALPDAVVDELLLECANGLYA